MKRTTKRLSVGIMAMAFLGYWFTGGEDGAPPEAASQIKPPAKADRPASTIAGLGVVEPAGGTIELASELPGVIFAIHVAEGDRVRRGDLIAELGNGELKAKVAQGEAQLAIRKADLLRIENGSRNQEVAQAESRVAELTADVELAEADFQRAAKLQKSGAISKKGLQTAGNARTAARQQLKAAVQGLSLIVEGARVEELAAARAEVALAEEQLAEAKAYLTKTFIRASSDGTVLRLFKEAGEAVSTQPSTAIAEIGDTSKLVVRAQIDEAEIAGLAIGQTAEITAPAFGDHRLSGEIVRVSPRIGTKIVDADTAGEKRDSRVLDVIIALAEGRAIPVDLRVDVFIDPDSGLQRVSDASDTPLFDWAIRE
ncbi:hypothetical protein ASG43_04810 [Aureimonas sp. Leaf454]|uniref:HlyD family secretion protein n=1 Tax=Aureimonas sp. Leaf454 TaxID=1736381 RepID=UPI000702370B|nr:HlyD family efflux transporter periplasmic adaptor subunit [Aureimonas sp. Leaf454]KQT54866.1 hypothetical protein ASG43_04810 [Aureimonas sp. Leaf454]